MHAADNGNLAIRAACMRAEKVHVLRLAAGHVERPSDEAEAGALLAAKAEFQIHDLHTNLPAILKALAGVGRGEE